MWQLHCSCEPPAGVKALSFVYALDRLCWVAWFNITLSRIFMVYFNLIVFGKEIYFFFHIRLPYPLLALGLACYYHPMKRVSEKINSSND